MLLSALFMLLSWPSFSISIIISRGRVLVNFPQAARTNDILLASFRAAPVEYRQQDNVDSQRKLIISPAEIFISRVGQAGAIISFQKKFHQRITVARRFSRRADDARHAQCRHARRLFHLDYTRHGRHA